MLKNKPGQKWRVFAFDRESNLPVTGDAANITALISKDHAASVAVADTNPTEEGDGYYLFDVTQAEVNADHIAIRPTSSTSGVIVLGDPPSETTVIRAIGDSAINITVDDTEAALVQGVKLTVLTDVGDQTGILGVTNASGTVSLNVTDGDYLIRVSQPAGYLAIADVAVTVSGDTPLAIELTPVTIPANPSPSMCNVRVNVLDQHGDPVEGATITAKAKGQPDFTTDSFVANTTASSTTDSEGKVVFALIRKSAFFTGGTYRITCTISGSSQHFDYDVPDAASATAIVNV